VLCASFIVSSIVLAPLVVVVPPLLPLFSRLHLDLRFRDVHPPPQFGTTIHRLEDVLHQRVLVEEARSFLCLCHGDCINGDVVDLGEALNLGGGRRLLQKRHYPILLEVIRDRRRGCGGLRALGLRLS